MVIKKTVTKTNCNSSILAEAKVADMSNRAAKQAEKYFQNNRSASYYDTKVDGYCFRVTRDIKTGKISNSFLTIQNRKID